MEKSIPCLPNDSKKNISGYRVHYNKLNNSFKKELIFPLTNRGFFSEINNLLLAVLYCIDNNIKLKVYSKKWVSGRWSDYYNLTLNVYNGIIPVPYKDVFNISKKESLYRFYHKNLKKRLILQDNVWRFMRSTDFINRDFYFPELGINGNIFHAKRQLQKIILNHTSLVLNNLNTIDNYSYFIKNSAGIHVRRGDKVNGKTKEADFFNIESYVNKVLNINPDVKTFTICTDDYSVIEEFEKKYPSYEYFTFCKSNQKGYSQTAHNNLKNKELIQNEALNIIKDAHILTLTDYFVGTFSSNISRFIVLERDNNNCYSLDKPWYPT